MADPFLGEIQIYAFNFPPKGWATCDGQILAIAQNQALFSLLGTLYGGDGRTTFALPDLRERGPIHPGAGPGLSPYTQGQAGGSSTVALIQNQMPAHSHTLGVVAKSPGNQPMPIGNHFGVAPAGLGNTYGGSGGSGGSGVAIPPQGGAPHNNLQPFLALSFCIALVGIFPPRN